MLASGRKSDQDSDALRLYADAALLVAKLGASESVTYPLTSDRAVYLVVSAGNASVNGVRLGERNGEAIQDESELRITTSEGAEIVLVEAAAA